jgi:hypothetical protein
LRATEHDTLKQFHKLTDIIDEKPNASNVCRMRFVRFWLIQTPANNIKTCTQTEYS